MIRLVENRLFIDGYLDVASIKDDTVTFLFKDYKLTIHGIHLKIVSYSKNEMIIHGLLKQITFDYHEEK